jgi:acetylornithine deacetylase/succinyl-diaminopimelate desuccinylase-like protein
MVVVHLLALADLARRGVRLNRDVIFLATPDEEGGGRRGAGFLVRRHPELLYGAQYLLTEGGGILVGYGTRANVWGVAITEKAPCWVRLTATGTSGHAATAGSNAAVPRLLDALQRVRSLPEKVRVVPEVERMFARLAPLAAEEDRAGFAQLSEALEGDPEFRERFLSDSARAALVQDTLAVTVLRGAPRTNVSPSVAYAELDARLLPGRTCGSLLDDLFNAVDDPAITLEPLLAFEPRRSPVNTPLFRAIEAVAAEVDPGAVVVPRMIAGFTDAHYFRELGIVAYGFVPRWLPPAETRGIHGSNERISLRNLERGVQTLVRLLEVFGGYGSAP